MSRRSHRQVYFLASFSRKMCQLWSTWENHYLAQIYENRPLKQNSESFFSWQCFTNRWNFCLERFSTDDTDVIWQVSTMHLLSTYVLRALKYGRVKEYTLYTCKKILPLDLWAFMFYVFSFRIEIGIQCMIWDLCNFPRTLISSWRPIWTQ